MNAKFDHQMLIQKEMLASRRSLPYSANNPKTAIAVTNFDCGEQIST